MKKKLFPEHPILIVDDEVLFLESMTATLRLNGINHVECCPESRQVMLKLKERTYSLVLLDMLMPGIKGSELLVKIAAGYPELPVIVLTAVSDEENVKECLNKGAIDYIIKPFESQQLIDAARKALTR